MDGASIKMFSTIRTSTRVHVTGSASRPPMKPPSSNGWSSLACHASSPRAATTMALVALFHPLSRCGDGVSSGPARSHSSVHPCAPADDDDVCLSCAFHTTRGPLAPATATCRFLPCRLSLPRPSHRTSASNLARDRMARQRGFTPRSHCRHSLPLLFVLAPSPAPSPVVLITTHSTSFSYDCPPSSNCASWRWSLHPPSQLCNLPAAP